MTETKRKELILPSGGGPDWNMVFHFVQMDHHKAFFKYERFHPNYETMEIDVMVDHDDRIQFLMTLEELCELKVTRLAEGEHELNFPFENAESLQTDEGGSQ